jgi:thiol-disulfide isomerase/thioredoxin
MLVLAIAACAPESRVEPALRLELVDAPATTDLAGFVKSELVAAGARRTVLVYVGASWCEPCVHFHDAAAAGRLDDRFGTLRILAFDADRDVDALQRAGYKSELIPLFALPNPDGTASGKQIEGSLKGADAVAEITPRLQALLK